MRVWTIGLVAALGMAAGAAQAGETYSCAKDGASRTVSVVTQTDTGHACEVQYDKSGAPETLWYAQSDTAYCTDKAKGFVERLGGQGWSCTEADGTSAAVEPMPQPFAAAVEVTEPRAAMPAAPTGVTGATRAAPAQAVPLGNGPVDPSIQLRGTFH